MRLEATAKMEGGSEWHMETDAQATGTDPGKGIGKF